MRFIFSSLFVLGAGLALAQKPSFEVASIKPAAPQTDGRIMMMMGGDPGMFDFKHVNLRMLLTRAYGIKDYQLNGPDWMNSVFFDVQAKMPPDTAAEVKNQMLQTLLEERFGLKVHKESKEVPIYALVVGKNGPKLKPAAELPPNAPGAPQPKPGSGDGPGLSSGPSAPTVAFGAGGAGGSMGGANVNVNRNFSGGGRVNGPGTTMMRVENGRMVLTSKGVEVARLVDMLSRQVDRPIVDNTGITGYYDVDLEFKPEGGAMGGMRGMPMPMPRGDGGGAPGGSPAPDAVEAPSIFTAIQDQLGLKLESKKGPIDTIVVDHCEKAPIEN
jgi:uncharacterized protein (TIGR03435 family)